MMDNPVEVKADGIAPAPALTISGGGTGDAMAALQAYRASDSPSARTNESAARRADTVPPSEAASMFIRGPLSHCFCHEASFHTALGRFTRRVSSSALSLRSL